MTKLLKLTDVNLNYNTDNNLINVLQDVSFEVDYKETISVVGESGSGKTSLIMLIGGLEKASSGKIEFKDFEISSLKEDEISEIRRKDIGIVFQSFYLIPNYTAIENVSLALEINKIKDPINKAKEILDKFGLGKRLNNLPSQLSGGEQQRVAIARSIVMKPELILADEPTGNLDSKSGVEILNIFNQLHDKGNTIILVTHEEEVAKNAKRMILILDGKVKSDIKN